MDKINELVAKIESESTLENNITNIKSLHNLITKEKKNLNKLYNDVNNNDIQRPIKKYNQKTIEELNELFENTKDLSTKIKIYNTLTYKINIEIDNLIFNEESSNEESE